MSYSDPFGPINDEKNSKGDRRKPPPRPPPPKSQISSLGKNINIFGRRKSQKPPATAIVRPLSPSPTVPTGTLIDLHSSPSLALSEQNKHSVLSKSTSSLSSPVESGFEDDFGSVMSSGRTSPWGDSFSSDWPSPGSRSSPVLKVSINPISDVKLPTRKAPALPKPPSKRHYNYTPTIICVQPTTKPKPIRPPPPKMNTVDSVEDPFNGSPPMPSIPPPPPPPQSEDLFSPPPVPPRPAPQDIKEDESHCVAEFDYESDHADDLQFKAGDVIKHLNLINTEWARGELDGRSGLFPVSYVDIKVPPDESSVLDVSKVICTFPFTAETWDDLTLNEGDIITVTKRLNKDWLYGSCEDKRGQFPVNFVQDISDLKDFV